MTRMTRAELIEFLAKQIARRRHGTDDAWTVCISEASQQVSEAAIRERDGKR